MSAYRKRPVVIEAHRFQVDRITINPGWLADAFEAGTVYYQGGPEPYLTIQTLEGAMRANAGDWIIKGVAGELYPCKPAIFDATYEAVEAMAPTGQDETLAQPLGRSHDS